MSSTPPPLPLSLGDRPSSPALASPRPPPPTTSPFAPVLPPPGSRSPLVRIRSAAQQAPGAAMPKIKAKPFGEIGKEEEEWAAVTGAEGGEEGAGSAFSVGTRLRERGRPMVRKSFQVRKKEEDAATTALGKEMGALELAKTELEVMEKEEEQKKEKPTSSKEPTAEGGQMEVEPAAGAAVDGVEIPKAAEAIPAVVEQKKEQEQEQSSAV